MFEESFPERGGGGRCSMAGKKRIIIIKKIANLSLIFMHF